MLVIIKQIILSSEENNIFHLLVPKMNDILCNDRTEKPHDQVLRNYDFNKVGKSYSKSLILFTSSKYKRINQKKTFYTKKVI